MLRVIQRLVLAALALLALLLPARAQEFRIYTQVVNETTAPPAVIARSWTIFHAGKVYDFVDVAQEVIVFQPAHDQFTVLSLSRKKSTVVALEELKHYLKLAESRVDEYISQNPTSQVAAMLQFQLQPTFDAKFDAKERRLTLASPFLRYEAKCTPPLNAELVAAYIRYADQTAQLNSVLHPKSLFPGPRLVLNEHLRKQAVLPVSVDLQIKFEEPVHLRAEHEIRWELDARDREMIHHWETQLKGQDVKPIAFRDFQREMLAGDVPVKR